MNGKELEAGLAAVAWRGQHDDVRDCRVERAAARVVNVFAYVVLWLACGLVVAAAVGGAKAIQKGDAAELRDARRLLLVALAVAAAAAALRVALFVIASE